MTKKTDKELEELFGITPERITEIDEAATKGALLGSAAGKVVRGRPRKFGEHMQTIAFKETDSRVAEIDRRALRLGIARSDYLRALVERDLETT